VRIGIDIMGGDFAPESTVVGAIQASHDLQPDVKLVLIGDEIIIREIMAGENVDADNFEIIHTSEVIEMGDNPARAFTRKKKSSIFFGFDLLKSGHIDGFASAGNTGAMLVGTMSILKMIPGVIRPCIAAVIPKVNGNYGVILDVGINPDCRPEVLYQYGILGSIYIKSMLDIEEPKVALLNIGAEEEKGNLTAQSAFSLMKDTKEFCFTGNIEGHEIFNSNKADVIVCDGFTGNIVLKEAESFYAMLKKRDIRDDYFNKFNYEIYGGTPVLGVESNVVIGHGISNADTVRNMIIKTEELIRSGLSVKIKEVFKHD